MAVANFRAGAQGDELRVSARLVGSMIRRVQTQSVAGSTVFFCHLGPEEGRICQGEEDIDCPEGVCIRDVPKAWGIRISTLGGENREVMVFADTNGNSRYDDGEAVRYEAISPGPFVYVSSVEPNDLGVLDIVFVPPKPKTRFNDSTLDGIATVTLLHEQSGAQQVVSVNLVSGLVSVE